MMGLVYYSSRSGYTHRFMTALELPCRRIPQSPSEAMPLPDRPYVLICPTYADGQGRGAVPKQVIRFLNDPARRALIRGVIGSGNRNFGETFALGARIIADKCKVPVLYRFELAGTETDLHCVRTGLKKLWETECLTTA